MYISAISLMVTTGCNLSCAYCFEGEKRGEHMTANTAKRAVDWLLRSDVSGPSKELEITLFGGEPLINMPVIREVIPYARRRADEVGKHFTFTATTNGLLFSDEVADFWKEHGIGVLLSCDGLPEAHDMNRRFANGEGSYGKLAVNMDRILNTARSKQVRITVTPQTVHLTAKGVSSLLDLGFEHIAIYYTEETPWDRNSLITYQDQLYQIGEMYTEMLDQGAKRSVNPLDKGIKAMLRANSGACESENCNGDLHLCGAGRGYLAVGVDGTLYPCHRFATAESCQGSHAIGHIDTSLDETRRLPFLRMTRRNILGCDMPCADCKLSEVCSGSCTAANLAVTGNLLMRPRWSRFHELIRHEVSRAIVNHFGFKRLDDFERCQQKGADTGVTVNEEGQRPTIHREGENHAKKEEARAV
ncbi:MAG: 4Fe-4S cluster-binding domain-containing protein [Myxococcota bacterium]|nr:4Fe-4S cluster-binding domain-containing protein [Myxococcota bacterium]